MKLYYMPVSTYSQKVLTALAEKGLETEREIVDLRDAAARERYREVYPLGKVPLLVLEDGHQMPESSIIIEYLDMTAPRAPRLIPADPTASRQTRFHDRMLDLHFTESLVTLLFESWKPAAARDAERQETARFRAGVIYDFMEQRLADRTWLMGEDFTLADCAAAPALGLARDVLPFNDRPNIAAYWQRLAARPSWASVEAEAAPWREWALEQTRAAASA